MSATRQDTPDRAGFGVLLAVFCIVTVAASVAFAAVWVSGVNPSNAPCQVGGQTVTRTTVSTFPNEECQ